MTTKRPSLCLNMIVRNEAHVIRRCLKSVRSLIDYWVISDTGSEDGTQKLIRDELAGIPGELIERPWIDFSHNRNEALEHAQGKADYLLFIDADEVLHVDESFTTAFLHADSYLVEMRAGYTSYLRRQIVRGDLPCRYKGVLHEYLECEAEIHEEVLLSVYTQALPDGARSQNPLKYRLDALTLEKALLNEPYNSRYLYYLAQSYLCAGDFHNAKKYFARRVEMGGAAPEVSSARYRIACCQELTGSSWPEVMQAFLEAFEHDPLRAEPLYQIGLHYQKRKEFRTAHLFFSRAIDISMPPLRDALLLEADIYRWLLPIEYAVSCYHVGDVRTASQINHDLLATADLPASLYSMVERNQGYCVAKLEDTIEWQHIESSQLSGAVALSR